MRINQCSSGCPAGVMHYHGEGKQRPSRVTGLSDLTPYLVLVPGSGPIWTQINPRFNSRHWWARFSGDSPFPLGMTTPATLPNLHHLRYFLRINGYNPRYQT